MPTDTHWLTPRLALRPLVPADAPVLAARLAAMEPWRGLDFTPVGLERYLTRADPALDRYGLWLDEALSGAVAVRAPWLRGACLELLAILPEAQGRGAGQRILAWLDETASRHGRNLWVTVSATNDGARRFYARHGFQPAGELPDLVKAGRTEILMRRRF